MARIKIDNIFEYLNKDIRDALDETMKQHFSDEKFDNRELFQTFKKNISKKFNSWEEVPDHLIRMRNEN